MISVTHQRAQYCVTRVERTIRTRELEKVNARAQDLILCIDREHNHEITIKRIPNGGEFYAILQAGHSVGQKRRSFSRLPGPSTYVVISKDYSWPSIQKDDKLRIMCLSPADTQGIPVRLMCPEMDEIRNALYRGIRTSIDLWWQRNFVMQCLTHIWKKMKGETFCNLSLIVCCDLTNQTSISYQSEQRESKADE